MDSVKSSKRLCARPWATARTGSMLMPNGTPANPADFAAPAMAGASIDSPNSSGAGSVDLFAVHRDYNGQVSGPVIQNQRFASASVSPPTGSPWRIHWGKCVRTSGSCHKEYQHTDRHQRRQFGDGSATGKEPGQMPGGWHSRCHKRKVSAEKRVFGAALRLPFQDRQAAFLPRQVAVARAFPLAPAGPAMVFAHRADFLFGQRVGLISLYSKSASGKRALHGSCEAVRAGRRRGRVRNVS